MSQHDTGTGAGPGVSRPVRLEPTAPGFWPLTLGVCIAALAPLFGFLAGVMMGRPADDARFGPLYWGLFIGIRRSRAGAGFFLQLPSPATSFSGWIQWSLSNPLFVFCKRS